MNFPGILWNLLYNSRSVMAVEIWHHSLASISWCPTFHQSEFFFPRKIQVELQLEGSAFNQKQEEALLSPGWDSLVTVDLLEELWKLHCERKRTLLVFPCRCVLPFTTRFKTAFTSSVSNKTWLLIKTTWCLTFTYHRFQIKICRWN